MLAPPKTFALTHPIEKKVVFDTKSINYEVSACVFRCGPLLSAGTASDFERRTYSCHITKTYNPPLKLGYPKKYAFQLPQMEYTRFPGAADEPPRADALRGLT